MHVLDRPIWSALGTGHLHLAAGDAHARRYPATISPFAAAYDGGAEAQSALAALVAPSEQVVLVEAGQVAVAADHFEVLSSATAVQMTNEQPIAPREDPRIVPLTLADAAEMLELALLTKPGPFTLRALELGPFWGIRVDGRLAAMAGHRLTMPGWTELSGVCAHPDFRGQGLARVLSQAVAQRISARGDKVFLHSYANNPAALRLYESLGFAVRSEMAVVVARRR